MTQSKFQLVGSLLRPADLLDYKNKIEHRDDIQYPFYDSFPGYRETETAEIKKVIADEKANGIDILNVTLQTTATLLKTMMADSTKHVKTSVFALPSHFQVKIIIF